MARVTQRQAFMAARLHRGERQFSWVDVDTCEPSRRKGALGNVPFSQVHHGRSFVCQDGLVRVDAGVQLVAQLPCLDDSSGMPFEEPKSAPGRRKRDPMEERTMVEEVEAAVDPDAPLQELWLRLALGALQVVLIRRVGHSGNSGKFNPVVKVKEETRRVLGIASRLG